MISFIRRRIIRQPADFMRNLRYWRKVRSMMPQNLIGYWPLWEQAGNVAYDWSGRGHNGTHVGVTLGQPGIGDGRYCPFFDGINDYVDIFSAGLTAAFNGAEGMLMAWGRVADIGIWTSGVQHYLARFATAAADDIRLYHSGNNTLTWYYRAGGVAVSRILAGLTTTDWMCMGISWSASADEVRCYYNGAQVGATLNGLGIWAGPLNLAVIGAATAAGGTPWSGWGAHVVPWDTPLTPAQVARLWPVH
jgi:hypothetical protein